MPDRGQLISFFVVLSVIAVAGWQILSQERELSRPERNLQTALVAESSGASAESGPSDQELIRQCGLNGCPVDSSRSAFLVIDDGASSPKEFALEAASSTTALNLLQEACAAAGFPVKTSAYDFGVIVEAINNKHNGDGGMYWLCFVNGVMPTLPLDKIAVQPGDKIEFKFAPR